MTDVLRVKTAGGWYEVQGFPAMWSCRSVPGSTAPALVDNEGEAKMGEKVVHTVDAILERVRAFRRARGWSINRLAGEAGMPESTIRDMDAADWSPTVATLRKLEALIPKSFDPDDQPVTARLRALRSRAGLSMQQMADAWGLGRASSYQRYEDPNLFKDRDLPLEMVEKAAPLLVGRGELPITAYEVLGLAGLRFNAGGQLLSPVLGNE